MVGLPAQAEATGAAGQAGIDRHACAGRIALAGLDVFWNEPAIDPAFATLPNLVLAPHAASGTVETRKAMGRLMRDNVDAFFAGNPLPAEGK